MSLVQRLTGLQWRQQGPAVLVGMGHGATHWVMGTFYLLLPFIAKALHLSYTEAGLLVSTVHISSFATNIFSGALVDVTGRRVQILVASLTVGALALASFGMADGVLGLLPLVVLIGCTNNMWHPAAISYISRRFPQQRGYALSIHALGANSGDALAPMAVGVALVWLSWSQAATAACMPTLAVALLLFLALPRQSNSERAQISAGEGMDLATYFKGLTTLLCDRAVLSLCLVAALRTMTQAGLLASCPYIWPMDSAQDPSCWVWRWLPCNQRAWWRRP